MAIHTGQRVPKSITKSLKALIATPVKKKKGKGSVKLGKVKRVK